VKRQAGRIIDLSYPLENGTPVFPGDPPIEVTILESIQNPPSLGSRSLNCSKFQMSVHTGTHVEAPSHFVGTAATIDRVPLEQCVGPALVADLRGMKPREEIQPAQFTRFREKLRGISKVILHTGWSSEWKGDRYFTDHPRLSGGAAQLLMSWGIHLVGIDAPSVDHAPFPAHLAARGKSSGKRELT
jgi:kynurenine formamidase